MKKVLIGILVGVLIAGLGAGSYFLVKNYDKQKEGKTEETDKKNPTKDKELDINDDLVRKLYSYVFNCNQGENFEPYNPNMRTSFFINNRTINTKTMSAEDKFFCALQFINPNEIKDHNNIVFDISKSELESRASVFFGPDVKLTEKNFEKIFIRRFNSPHVKITLKNNRYYLEAGYGFGLLPIPYDRFYTKLSRAYTKGDLLKLEEDFFIVESNEINDENWHIRVYNNNINKKEITSFNVKFAVMDENNKDGLLAKLNTEEQFKKGSKVVYTFKKHKDGNYYFDSSEVIDK